MSDSTETVRTLVERLRAAFGTEPPVQLAVLFGSAAGGIRRPDSDIDVAILPVPPGLEPIEEAALCHRLARAGRADVDLIRLDTSLSTLLRWQIATTGVPLVERYPAHSRASTPKPRPSTSASRRRWHTAYHGEIFRRRLMEQGRTR